MAAFPRQHYIDMVEKHYFGNVDRKNMQAVLDCFQEDGSLTVQTAPITHEGRDAGDNRECGSQPLHDSRLPMTACSAVTSTPGMAAVPGRLVIEPAA